MNFSLNFKDFKSKFAKKQLKMIKNGNSKSVNLIISIIQT